MTSKTLSVFRPGLMALAVSAWFAIPAGASAEQQPEDVSPIVSGDSLAGNYLAARIASTDKDTQHAAAFYRKALATDPENEGLKLKAFFTFIANGNFSEGMEIGSQIAKSEQSPEVVHLIVAADDLRRKSWKKALTRLQREWRSPLDRLMAGLLTGWLHQGQGNTKKALAEVDRLSGPDWYDLFKQYQGGLIALVAKDNKEAIRRLATAVDNRAGGQAATDTYLRAVKALAVALSRDGQKENALKTVDIALERMPQNAVFERLKDDIESGKKPDFDVVNAQRGGAEVFMNLGTAINREGGEQFARIFLQLSSLLAENSDVVLTTLAELFDKQGKIVRANDLFSRIPPTSPYANIARLETALNLDELEQFDKARIVLDKLARANPDDLITHLSYGAVLARHEKFTEAIDVYKSIIDRIEKPTQIHWSLFYRLGIAYERTKQWPLAETAFRKALELSPNQPSVMNYMGYSWVDMDINLQEGLDMIRKAVDLRPNDGYMVDSLGWAYYRLDRFQEAVVELERAVELRPGDPTINDHLGDAYWRANRKLEATFQWRHALALDPPEADIARIEEKLSKGLDEVLKKEAAAKKNGADDKEG